MSLQKAELVDVEAELAALGSVLEDALAWDAVADAWRPGLFTSMAHVLVAEAVGDMYAQRKPVDRVTVNGALRDRQVLGRQVPEDFTELVLRAAASRSAVRGYVDRLADLAAKRELRRVAIDVLSYDDASAETLVGRAQRALAGISGAAPDRMRHIGAIVGDVLTRLLTPEPGATETIPTGFTPLDNTAGGLRPGALAVFAARPSSGKSSLAVALADNIAARGIPVGAFWLEDEGLDFGRRLLLRRTGFSTAQLRAPEKLTGEQHARLQSAEMLIQRLPIFVDDTHGLTATQIANRMRRMHREHGARVFIADHLGEMRVEREERWGERHDLSIGLACRTFRDAAKELNAVPVLFAQMNRAVERRADAMPKLSDLEGSGQIEQAARFVGFISRQDDRFVIDVQKNTYGITGALSLKWVRDSMSVEEAPPSWQR